MPSTRHGDGNSDPWTVPVYPLSPISSGVDSDDDSECGDSSDAGSLQDIEPIDLPSPELPQPMSVARYPDAVSSPSGDARGHQQMAPWVNAHAHLVPTDAPIPGESFGSDKRTFIQVTAGNNCSINLSDVASHLNQQKSTKHEREGSEDTKNDTSSSTANGKERKGSSNHQRSSRAEGDSSDGWTDIAGGAGFAGWLLRKIFWNKLTRYLLGGAAFLIVLGVIANNVLPSVPYGNLLVRNAVAPVTQWAKLTFSSITGLHSDYSELPFRKSEGHATKLKFLPPVPTVATDIIPAALARNKERYSRIHSGSTLHVQLFEGAINETKALSDFNRHFCAKVQGRVNHDYQQLRDLKEQAETMIDTPPEDLSWVNWLRGHDLLREMAMKLRCRLDGLIGEMIANARSESAQVLVGIQNLHKRGDGKTCEVSRSLVVKNVGKQRSEALGDLIAESKLMCSTIQRSGTLWSERYEEHYEVG